MTPKHKKLLIVLLSIFSLINNSNVIGRAAEAKSLGTNVQERKINLGDKVNVSNRYDFGSISITGWDGDTAWAVATTEDGTESLPVTISEDQANARRILIATSPEGNRQITHVHLDVKIPRSVELEPIFVPKARLNVTNIEGSVEVRSDSGSIIVQRAGSVKARTGSGEIQLTGVSGPVTLRTSSANVIVKGIKGDLIADVGSANMRVTDADGLINVTTTTGNLEVENAGGDVRVVSINGRTKIHCAKGHVDVSDTSGVTTLTGIGGDVDVMTSSGRASLTGALRAGGRYRLRTLSGAVQMIVPSDAVNFGVTLSSYSGHIEGDFVTGAETAPPKERAQSRVIRRFGDGRTQIELDAFNGSVRLSKTSPSAIEKCER